MIFCRILKPLIYRAALIYTSRTISSIFYIFRKRAVISEFQILEDGKTVEIAMTGNEGVLGLLPVFDSYRATNWMQVSLSGKALKIDSRIFEQKIVAHFPFQKLLEYINFNQK